MKPARSPRFQSDADRCSIAAISCGGFPNGIVGADGNISSMNPGPGQLLSVTSICSSIGSSPLLVGAGASWVAYSLPRDSDLASDTDYRVLGPCRCGPL